MKNLTEIERAEWLDIRRTGIGGSDVAAIMGLSPFRTAVDVWLDKVDPQPYESSSSMYFGTLLEPVICKEFERRTGKKVQNVNYVIRNPAKEWQIANIDRAIINPSIAKTVRLITDIDKINQASGRLLTTDIALEAKTSNAFSSREWGRSQEDDIVAGKEPEDHEIPLFYETQLQWYCGVLNLRGMYLSVLIGGNDFRMYWIKARPDIFARLASDCGTFWNENVLKKIKPNPVNTEDIIKLYKKSTPESSIEATGDIAIDYGEAVRLDSEIKTLDKQLDAVKTRIKAAMKENEILTLDGKKVASYKTVISNRFDSKNFKKDKPDLYAQYLAPLESRQFRLY